MRDNRSSRVYRGLLQMRGIYERRCRLAQARMLNVADDPDNLPWALLVYRIRIVTQENLLPNRVLGWEETARKCFVHHHCPRRTLGIVFIEIAPPLQRNPKRPEKTRTDFVVTGARPLVWLCFRL